jgi:four helix bundle suffix protein
VARASLEELLEDYRDFMRDRDSAEWDRNHRYARRLSELNRNPDEDYETFCAAVENEEVAIRVDAIAGLIKVTNYLLDQQIRRLGQDFFKEGGLRERMTRARLDARDEQRRRGK